MLSTRQIRHTRHVLVLVGICLAIFYLLFYKPLARRAAALDQPLQEVWQHLAAIRLKNNGAQQINLEQIQDNLEKTKASFERLTNASQTISAQVALEPEIRAKMKEPFQFVDFQIEQQLRIEELTRRAQQNHVTLHSSVFTHFPEYTTDQGTPNLLWLQLLFLDELLNAAVACKVSDIKDLDLPLITGYQLATNQEHFLYEVPIRVEIVGTMSAVSQLLACLPVRHEQAKAMNLPEMRPVKPALFIHRFFLKKNSPENPDEVHLDLRVCGFFYRD